MDAPREMKRKAFLITGILCCAFCVWSSAFAQDCSSQRSKIPQAPEYKIGRNLHWQKEPTRFLALISIPPQFFTRTHMIALGKQLNLDFCDEKRIRAIIVDDHRAATIWEPIHLAPFYGPAERGEYYLDRATGEEYLEFSTKRGRGVDGFIRFAPFPNRTRRRTYKGAYRNSKFRYFTKLPASLEGISEVPEEIEGGILITLSKDPERFIWLGGAYDTSSYASLREATDSHLDWLRTDGAKVLNVKRQKSQLGKLNAERITVRYEAPGSDVINVMDLVVALRFQRDASAIVHQIEMRTTASNYTYDVKAFNSIARSWRHSP